MVLSNSNDLESILKQLDIEKRFHETIIRLCNGEAAYLCDIDAQDFAGQVDDNSVAIAPPVARGLVRKLANFTNVAPFVPTEERTVFENSSVAGIQCAADTLRLTLWHDKGSDGPCLCCAINAKPAPSGGDVRRKLLTAVLDRSGSMTRHWSLLVKAVSRVVTDELLADPFVSVCIVVYDGTATEVPLPASSDMLHSQLLREFAPNRGITCFQAAFEVAATAIQRMLKEHTASGLHPQDIDVATLLFTDGQDTSLPPRGAPSAASANAARAAGDRFRQAVKNMGCASYISIAAFGEDHSPELCQCLSDRYTYINRQEVLSDWLASGLDEMLASAGQCSVSISTPAGITIEEVLPPTLPLNANGSLTHHVMMRLQGPSKGTINVDVCTVGGLPTHACISCEEALQIKSGSFEHHMFNLNKAALELRKLAQELSGKQPSTSEIDRMRARLVSVRQQVGFTKDAAWSAKGSLRGKAALRLHANEVDSLRDRLSYAIGHFDVRDQDQRKMGTVAIDAVLRDAGQHKPFGDNLAALIAQAEDIDTLTTPEELSRYAHKVTLDMHSGCNAQELAQGGDALFFQLHGVQTSSDGDVAMSIDSTAHIAHEAFLILSNDGQQEISLEGKASFTHVGIPLYVTPGHFERVRRVLPQVLGRLFPIACKTAMPERKLLSLLGHALATGRASRGALGAASRAEYVSALLQKARSVHAILSTTTSPDGNSLLDKMQRHAEHYAEQSSDLPSCKDLHSIVAVALVSNWPPAKIAQLGKVVVGEWLRRIASNAMMHWTQEERLWLAWALLGPADASMNLIDQLSLDHVDNMGVAKFEGYNPFTAGDELESLDHNGPSAWAPRSHGLMALRAIFSHKAPVGTPSLIDCGNIMYILTNWGTLCDTEAGLEKTWQRLDAAMVYNESCKSYESWLEKVTDQLCPSGKSECVHAAIGCSTAFVSIVIAACGIDMNYVDSTTDMRHTTLRSAVASATRAFVAQRAELVRQYPIHGAEPPAMRQFTPQRATEVWGAGAVPKNENLYADARAYVLNEETREFPMTVKMALVEKKYRAMGGTFAFRSPLDTFIEGLHRRTKDLHEDFVRQGRNGRSVRKEAIDEMLLRLRWDDSNNQHRVKLSQIIKCIWDGLQGVKSKETISSALWLNDDDDEDWVDVSAHSNK